MGVITVDSYKGVFENTYSLLFDGIDERVVISDNAAFTPTALSVSAWVKWASTAFPASQAIIAKYNGGVASEWLLYKNSIHKITWFLTSNATETNTLRIDSSTAVVQDVWYHIVGTWNGGFTTSDIKLYINGVSEGTATEIGSFTGFPNTATEVSIGAAKDTSAWTTWMNGRIDEVCTWNTGLSSTQASEAYNAGNVGNLLIHSASSNIISYWRCGDGDTYPTIAGTVGGHNGTMTNMESGDINTDVP